MDHNGEFIQLPRPDKYVASTNYYGHVTVRVQWSITQLGDRSKFFKRDHRFIFCQLNSMKPIIKLFKCSGIDYSHFSTNKTAITTDTISFRFDGIDPMNKSEYDQKIINEFEKGYIMGNLRTSIVTTTINSMYGTPQFMAMPRIDEVYFSKPYTTVKWIDGTTTTVKCRDDDEFNKEIGVSMAITRKYYESVSPNPRASFKKLIYKDAIDQTTAIQNRKEKKKSARLKALIEPEKEISNGDISASEEPSS
jgi:hypothetical protein